MEALTLTHLSRSVFSPAGAFFATIRTHAYPNPFNGGISIPFRVDTDGDVRVVIHGMAGQVVRVLEMGQLPAGDYASPSRAAFWDGVTDEGANAASGVYLLTVEAAGARTRSKIALVR